jgi:ribosomal protein L11 methyltransferase
MEYIVAEFNISCPPGLMQTARDLVADTAAEAGFESFEDTPQGLRGYVQKNLLDRSKLDDNLKDFLLENTTITYTLGDVENKDWNEQWEEAGFAPVYIDNRIVILDARRGKQDFSPDAIPIYIYARQAFGTGTHQTTKMIISTLLNIPLQGKRILDCGCGSGILSITASKLGAEEVIGYDIDEWSVDNTRHNAEQNQVSNLTVFHGNASVLNRVSGLFDVVLANINRNALIQDMPAIAAVMAPGATLVISGFYEEDVPKLLKAANDLNLHEEKRLTQDNWCCLEFRQYP